MVGVRDKNLEFNRDRGFCVNRVNAELNGADLFPKYADEITGARF